MYSFDASYDVLGYFSSSLPVGTSLFALPIAGMFYIHED